MVSRCRSKQPVLDVVIGKPLGPEQMIDQVRKQMLEIEIGNDMDLAQPGSNLRFAEIELVTHHVKIRTVPPVCRSA
jgi:hypothetical protein